jgi:uracil-DNA glycosylase
MIFKVFEQNINNIKIILLGQDPYIKKDQAMGLSFSVPKNVKIPPSLYNIFKEIKQQFPERNYNFTHGDLTEWQSKGIFLLNSSLTVELGKSNSHQSKWTWFSDAVIKYIDNKRDDVVFLLLGRNAIDKQIFIKNNKNHIITGVHPSPLSAYNGFFESKVFKKVENKLNCIFDWSN